MRLCDLQLDDFGCFQNAQMGSIDDGLVVVGGPQRAGKTTLMQVVRQLGWGIKRDDSLPPPVDEYRLYAQFANDEERHILNLDGHSKPDTAPLDGSSERSVEEIFGGISRLQYEQLFTISLSELQRLPPGIESEEDLSEVLLGGAYGDIADIPAMEEVFGDRAYEIGRTYGKPTKRSQLRDPMDTIEDGLELRKEATAQVDTHREKADELTKLQNRIANLESRRESFTQERKRLSVIETEFTDIRAFQNLRRSLEDADIAQAEAFPADGIERAKRLQEEYSAACAAREDAEDEFRTVTESSGIEADSASLLEQKEVLERANEKISGWDERVSQVEEGIEEIESSQASLKSRIADLHPTWNGERTEIKQVETDLISKSQVTNVVSTFERATEQAESTRRSLESKREQLEKAQETVTKLEEEPSNTSENGVIRTAAVIAGVGIIAGGGASLAGFPFIGLGVTSILFLLSLLYISRGVSADETAASPIREAKAHVNALESDVHGLEQELDSHENTRDKASEELTDIRDTLGLPAEIPPAGVESFFEEVVELEAELRELEETERVVGEKQATLADELRDVSRSVSAVTPFEWDDDTPLENAQALFAAIESAAEAADAAEAVEVTKREQAEIAEEISILLSEWEGVESLDSEEITPETARTSLQQFIEAGEEADAIVEEREEMESRRSRLLGRFETPAVEAAFTPVREPVDETWLDTLEREAGEFVDQEAVGKQREQVADEISSIDDQLDAKREEKIDLQRELEKLASDDDLVEARETITEGQQELQRLGEEYAVNRIAESLTEKLHERFIEEVAGSLIDEAGAIFKRITTDYQGITHTDELDDLRFKALREGKPSHDSSELSRATAEQLYLAIRIARIRQLDTTLPLILDDSMANFDPSHGARMIQTVNELAKTHQVFLLTCHPEQVALAENHADVSQFWCLDDGQFDGPYDRGEAVKELLTGDSGQLQMDVTLD